MAISKIVQNSIDETSVSLGVKITNVQVANSSYTVLDDTAVNVGGGYIVITGNGFKSNPQVLIGQNTACSITFIDSTTIRAEVPAKDAGTYPVYVVNTDGAVGIRVPGLTYSGFPTWVTGSTLPDQEIDEAISIQLEATGANTYALQTGSTLPSGMVLNTANGLLTGTVTGVEEDTLYNFTIEAIDTENQESPRAFNVTITVGDEYFNQTVLLLNGDGTSGANNNVFRDSSNNNFAITRNGNTTQGTFTPVSVDDGAWSVYIPTDDRLQAASNTDFSLGSSGQEFTIEFWMYPTSNTDYQTVVGRHNYSAGTGWGIWRDATFGDGPLAFWWNNGSSKMTANNWGTLTNSWNHVAVTKNASNTLTMYVNGNQVNTAPSGTWTDASTQLIIGGNENGVTWNGTYGYQGYISNLSIIKGTAKTYTAGSPPTNPLDTNQTNQVLLTTASNRFFDRNTTKSAKTVTSVGSSKVTTFSPFRPTAAYDASVNGGSGYFDGSGDYLTCSQTLWSTNGNATFEAWIYVTNNSVQRAIFDTSGQGDFCTNSDGSLRVHPLGANWFDTPAGSLQVNAWNHVALVQTATTREIFINGIKQTQTNVNGSPNTVAWDNPTGVFTIAEAGQRNDFPGYMSDIRVSNTAIYTENFSVPSSPLVPISGTNLLLNFTNAGILDYTAKNVIETVGDARVNTAVTKYGTGSISFDGTGDYLVFPTSNFFNPYQGEYTVEMWIYTTNISSGGTTASRYGNLLVQQALGSSIQWGLGFNSSGQLVYTYWNGSATQQITHTTETISINTWVHIGFTYTSSGVALFVNGVFKSATALTGTPATNTTEPMFIGIEGRTGGSELYYAGFIDDLRITKGVARYTTTFTPPTGTFPKK